MKLGYQHFATLPTLHFAEGPASGPPLLLLHGVSRNWRDWDPLLPDLTRQWNVLAMDHRGHGDSARAPGGYLVVDYARHVAEFVRTKYMEPITVMGHSLGAMVALSLAAECGLQIAAIILEDPPFHSMGRKIGSTPYWIQFEGMREVARSGGNLADMADALAQIRLSPTQRLGDIRDRASLEFSASCLGQVDPEVFTPLIDGRWLDQFDANEYWSRVQCPVLLLQGDSTAGGTFTDEDVALACRSLRSYRLLRFNGTGHQIHRTRTAETLAALSDFYRDLVAPL